jgi:hypothetical protein
MSLDLVALLAGVAAAAASSLGSIEAVRAFVRRGDAERVDLTLDKGEVDEALHALREKLTGPAGAGSKTPSPGTPPTPAELEALAIMEVYGKEPTGSPSGPARSGRARSTCAKRLTG